MKRVLLTGGTGYIGSHTCVALVDAGFSPVVLDDFSNSRPAVLDRLARITGAPVPFVRGDVADRALVTRVLTEHWIEAVVHFAAFKAVGESVHRPLAYYRNNVGGLVAMLEAMDTAGCRTLVYSSSATVYGDPERNPIPESAGRSATNPYAHTKLMGEDILADLARADGSWRIGVPRYFNPVGAHPSGLIGEDPLGVPANLMPYVSQVAVGRRPHLDIYGDDWPTPDGTGVRDYVHVMDLAEGHVAVLRALVPGTLVVNLGTGRGYSVREMVAAMERASGRSIATRVVSRRSGDVATCFADVTWATERLGWRARRTLDEMCASAWRWQRENPDGYG